MSDEARKGKGVLQVCVCPWDRVARDGGWRVDKQRLAVGMSCCRKDGRLSNID